MAPQRKSLCLKYIFLMQTWTNPTAVKSSPFSPRAKIQEDFFLLVWHETSLLHFHKNTEIWARRGLGRLYQPPMDLAHSKHHCQKGLKMTATFPCSRWNLSPFPLSSLPCAPGLGTHLVPHRLSPRGPCLCWNAQPRVRHKNTAEPC